MQVRIFSFLLFKFLIDERISSKTMTTLGRLQNGITTSFASSIEIYVGKIFIVSRFREALETQGIFNRGISPLSKTR